METKLNKVSITDYSSTFAEKVVDEFFQDKQKISGTEILNLCKIHQINLFIIKNLFDQWKDITKKLKLPYFDHDSDEVKKAMEAYMNTLSQHILIQKNDLFPLLKEAVCDTILLIFAPYDFFVGELKKDIFLDNLRADHSYLKYFKINKHLLESFIDALDKENEISIDKSVEVFNNVCSEMADLPENFEPYIEEFSQILPLTLSVIYDEQEENKTFENDLIEKSSHITATKETATINDLLKKDQSTTSLVEQHQQKKISRLQEYLTIHERFLFTNELFGGDNSLFEEIVNKIDTYDSFENVISYLNDNFHSSYNWQEKEDIKDTFFDLIAKKF